MAHYKDNNLPRQKPGCPSLKCSNCSLECHMAPHFLMWMLGSCFGDTLMPGLRRWIIIHKWHILQPHWFSLTIKMDNADLQTLQRYVYNNMVWNKLLLL